MRLLQAVQRRDAPPAGGQPSASDGRREMRANGGIASDRDKAPGGEAGGSASPRAPADNASSASQDSALLFEAAAVTSAEFPPSTAGQAAAAHPVAPAGGGGPVPPGGTSAGLASANNSDNNNGQEAVAPSSSTTTAASSHLRSDQREEAPTPDKSVGDTSVPPETISIGNGKDPGEAGTSASSAAGKITLSTSPDAAAPAEAACTSSEPELANPPPAPPSNGASSQAAISGQQLEDASRKADLAGALATEPERDDQEEEEEDQYSDDYENSISNSLSLDLPDGEPESPGSDGDGGSYLNYVSSAPKVVSANGQAAVDAAAPGDAAAGPPEPAAAVAPPAPKPSNLSMDLADLDAELASFARTPTAPKAPAAQPADLDLALADSSTPTASTAAGKAAGSQPPVSKAAPAAEMILITPELDDDMDLNKVRSADDGITGGLCDPTRFASAPFLLFTLHAHMVAAPPALCQAW